MSEFQEEGLFVATGASIEAANLNANWIGEEVQLTDVHDVVTLTGRLEKFSIGSQPTKRDPKGNPVSPTGSDRFAVQVRIGGHKMQVPGSRKIAMLAAGLPADLPVR